MGSYLTLLVSRFFLRLVARRTGVAVLLMQAKAPSWWRDAGETGVCLRNSAIPVGLSTLIQGRSILSVIALGEVMVDRPSSRVPENKGYGCPLRTRSG
ncbi:MAG: hypothetical protein ONB30_11410 [candidate division KSB1 bacterium]|nr:hypothetical protein [candidate division KSB1 bacterium]